MVGPHWQLTNGKWRMAKQSKAIPSVALLSRLGYHSAAYRVRTWYMHRTNNGAGACRQRVKGGAWRGDHLQLCQHNADARTELALDLGTLPVQRHGTGTSLPSASSTNASLAAEGIRSYASVFVGIVPTPWGHRRAAGWWPWPSLIRRYSVRMALLQAFGSRRIVTHAVSVAAPCAHVSCTTVPPVPHMSSCSALRYAVLSIYITYRVSCLP